MEWLLKDQSAAYIIFRWRPLTADEKTAEFVPSAALITSWLDNLNTQAVMREMYQVAYGKSAGTLDFARKREIVQQLESAFRRQLLICLRATRVTPGGVSEKADAPAPAPPPPPPRPAKNKTWIAIELVDDKGKPIAGERYRIETPDGSFVEGQLDAQGRARLDYIDYGECQVGFPDIDGREWGPA